MNPFSLNYLPSYAISQTHRYARTHAPSPPPSAPLACPASCAAPCDRPQASASAWPCPSHQPPSHAAWPEHNTATSRVNSEMKERARVFDVHHSPCHITSLGYHQPPSHAAWPEQNTAISRVNSEMQEQARVSGVHQSPLHAILHG